MNSILIPPEMGYCLVIRMTQLKYKTSNNLFDQIR